MLTLLPPELVGRVLSFANSISVCRVRRTCKALRAIVEDTPTLEYHIDHLCFGLLECGNRIYARIAFLLQNEDIVRKLAIIDRDFTQAVYSGDPHEAANSLRAYDDRLHNIEFCVDKTGVPQNLNALSGLRCITSLRCKYKKDALPQLPNLRSLSLIGGFGDLPSTLIELELYDVRNVSSHVLEYLQCLKRFHVENATSVNLTAGLPESLEVLDVQCVDELYLPRTYPPGLTCMVVLQSVFGDGGFDKETLPRKLDYMDVDTEFTIGANDE